MTAGPENRPFWLAFGAVAALVLVPMIVAGVVHRSALEPLLRTGGIVESLPALIFLVTALLSGAAALRGGPVGPWAAFAALNLFLAGEEARWGAESVLGLRLRGSGESGTDLHNTVASGIEALFFDVTDPGVPESVLFAVYALVMLAAFGFLAGAILLGVRGLLRPVPNRLHVPNPSLQFAITGFGLLLFGNVDILESAFGFPYMPGIWPLEESYELLGSVAFLFAVLVRPARAVA